MNYARKLVFFVASGILLCIFTFVYHKHQQEKMLNTLQRTTSHIDNHYNLNDNHPFGQNDPLQEPVFYFSEGGSTIVEFDHKLDPLPYNKPRPNHIQRAETHGARAKITLRVVNSVGNPVQGATLFGGFWNNDPNDQPASGVTDENGLITVENKCTGDFNFSFKKEGYYKTTLRYWFFKAGFDCVKDGRWIPWNPIVGVVLKEKRNPVPLYTRQVVLVFPKKTKVGFDCLAEDIVEPFGRGKVVDFHLVYDSVRPPVRNGMKYPVFTCFTNSLTLSVPEGGGFISKQKDMFSQFVAEYEAPKNGYVTTIDYGIKRTTDKMFADDKLNDDEYLFFKSRSTKTDIGNQNANYGKIYKLSFGESLSLTNEVTLRISYYFNPEPNERNLEFDGETNLFNPDWRDYKWPKEP